MIDAVQSSGLGGTDSRSPLGRPLERYRSPVESLQYAFTLEASPPVPAIRDVRAATATGSPVVD